jgi:hypothetical protein
MDQLMAERVVVRQKKPILKHLTIMNTVMDMEANTIAGTIVTAIKR